MSLLGVLEFEGVEWNGYIFFVDVEEVVDVDYGCYDLIVMVYNDVVDVVD